MNQSVYIIQCPPSWVKTAPLSLVYLYNYLTSAGFNVGIKDLNVELFKIFNLKQKEWLDINQEFEENIFAQAQEKAPQVFDALYETIKTYDAIGFSILKRNFPFSLTLAKKISEKFPSKKIIFGGPHTLFLDWQNKLDKQFNWVIGEGEMSLAEMLSGNKKNVLRFKELENLDEIKIVDFGGMPTNYSDSIPLLSSRGCPFNCKFCSERKLYKKFRHHSSPYVIELINYLKNKYKCVNFTFCDSLINYNNAWLEEFCVTLIKENLNVKWQAQMRVDKNFSSNLGGLMRESGCYNLFVGLESASDSVLAGMNKGFTQNVALAFLEKLYNARLQFEISLIFGYPGETEKDFQETLNFIVKNKKIIPKIAQANPFIDYFNDSDNANSPSPSAKSRILEFLKRLELEKIRYTKSFINNLV
jgi:radical SAM superfamily enzyme YgiQ (UPF0313 family)